MRTLIVGNNQSGKTTIAYALRDYLGTKNCEVLEVKEGESSASFLKRVSQTEKGNKHKDLILVPNTRNTDDFDLSGFNFGRLISVTMAEEVLNNDSNSKK